ncbi:MAG TPA: hypothetical protein VGB87_16750 [Vicinamibacteria bacterium]
MRTGRRRGPLAGLLAGGLAAVTLGVVAARETKAFDAAAAARLPAASAVSLEPARHPREKTYLKRQWGVEVMDVRQTAAGYMLEFRYKVLDAEKAKPLFERQTKPVLTHAETGAKLIVPTPAKTGALRNSNPPLAGRIYWMFFANPGKLVKQGQHVSVAIGAFQADGLVVQ